MRADNRVGGTAVGQLTSSLHPGKAGGTFGDSPGFRWLEEDTRGLEGAQGFLEAWESRPGAIGQLETGHRWPPEGMGLPEEEALLG